jgi:hypothetical protein
MINSNEIADTIENILTDTIGKYNDATTRHTIVLTIENYLESLQELDDYNVVCDERNNTAKTIAEQELNVDITMNNPYFIFNCTMTAATPPISATPDYLAITRAICG